MAHSELWDGQRLIELAAAELEAVEQGVPMRERYVLTVEGTVQGVGFRPFIYRLAAEHAVAGFVRNDANGVVIEVEGDGVALDAFVNGLWGGPPPLARVHRIQIDHCGAIGLRGFSIEESGSCPEKRTAIPADSATCDDCLAELFNTADRRYLFPFINCTDCGPRLTIIEELPYDRARTTMAGFGMCADCRAEYEDPLDRRFHAEPIACPACGPSLALHEAAGERVGTADPLTAAADALSAGAVVAVKGLGGYHLACDALDAEAVARLRQRKRRPAKPLAVMARDLEAVRALCLIDPDEERLLTVPERPIVLLRERSDCAIAEAVAPGLPELGIMLPYTPLHHLLLAQVGRPLVMTSGNLSDEPIAHRDSDAQARLSKIADLFLSHDRPIATACDDSVARTVAGRISPVRRSRGYAPQPLHMPVAAVAPVLGMGGDLKNAFALVRGREAFLSHHIGDLQDLRTYDVFRQALAHYAKLLDVHPEIVAHDMHPGYLSTRLALEMDGVEPIAVQHHHAHLAACLVEHGILERSIGVVFDGTGYGPDGTIWGGEFLVGNCEGFERAGHLATVPLPGGDAAVREPWRAAAAHLFAAFGSTAGSFAPVLVEQVGEKRWKAVEGMLRRPGLSVQTSSVGRLFDAVAALIGLRHAVDYEAQAAIELEAIADFGDARAYPVELEQGGVRCQWRPEPIISGVIGDLRRGRSQAEIAGKFHRTMSDAITAVCRRLRDETGLGRVALTGGVFQNARLARSAAAGLEASGFEVLMHRLVPANDGGLSFGQAAVACAVTAARARS